MLDSPSQSERLDYADRWLRDGLAVLRPALSVQQITVDMTNALAALERLRKQSVAASTTHLVVQAAAKALASNPQLHQIIAGTRRHRPVRVDIGLSVSGEACVAPVLVIEAADQKTIEELVAETTARTPQVQESDRKMLAVLRRWGRLVPVGSVRRAILRVLFSSPGFRQKGAGTFQVSVVPVDWAIAATFATAGVLIAGQVSSRVVAVDGQPVVRPTMTLTLSSDHGVWDGRAAARFLAFVKAELSKAV